MVRKATKKKRTTKIRIVAYALNKSISENASYLNMIIDILKLLDNVNCVQSITIKSLLNTKSIHSKFMRAMAKWARLTASNLSIKLIDRLYETLPESRRQFLLSTTVKMLLDIGDDFDNAIEYFIKLYAGYPAASPAHYIAFMQQVHEIYTKNGGRFHDAIISPLALTKLVGAIKLCFPPQMRQKMIKINDTNTQRRF